MYEWGGGGYVSFFFFVFKRPTMIFNRPTVKNTRVNNVLPCTRHGETQCSQLAVMLKQQ